MTEEKDKTTDATPEAPPAKKNYLLQAWLVLSLAACFGAALAGVQIALGGKIEENKRLETLDRIPELVPGAATGVARTIDGQTLYEARSADGKRVGWVVKASGAGFADRIEILIGLSADATVLTGMYVLDQKETPGLGNNIVKEAWRSQFADKPVVAGTPVSITPVTGATISSESVCNIINKTLAGLQGKLQAAGKEGAE